jgi:hypothetical protein
MPAKLKGLEVRETTSIRLQPSDKKLIVKHFGSLQLWVDECLAVLIKTKEKQNKKG